MLSPPTLVKPSLHAYINVELPSRVDLLTRSVFSMAGTSAHVKPDYRLVTLCFVYIIMISFSNISSDFNTLLKSELILLKLSASQQN